MTTDAKLAENLAFWRDKAEEYKRVIRSFGVFERSFVLSNGTMAQRQRYQELARFIKADEIAEVEAAFDDLFNTIESKENDSGDVQHDSTTPCKFV